MTALELRKALEDVRDSVKVMVGVTITDDGSYRLAVLSSVKLETGCDDVAVLYLDGLAESTQ